MDKLQKSVVAILIAISIVGILGIPIGAHKFIVEAFALEFSFITLAIISAKKFKYAHIPNFIIAAIIISGNTISPKHTEIMTTLHPLYNAIILIVGGYILQLLLLGLTVLAYRQYKQLAVSGRTRF